MKAFKDYFWHTEIQNRFPNIYMDYSILENIAIDF